MYEHFKRIEHLMTTLYDLEVENKAAIAALAAQVAALPLPTIDLTQFATASALAAVATQVAAIEAQVNPTPVAPAPVAGA